MNINNNKFEDNKIIFNTSYMFNYKSLNLNNNNS